MWRMTVEPLASGRGESSEPPAEDPKPMSVPAGKFGRDALDEREPRAFNLPHQLPPGDGGLTKVLVPEVVQPLDRGGKRHGTRQGDQALHEVLRAG